MADDSIIISKVTVDNTQKNLIYFLEIMHFLIKHKIYYEVKNSPFFGGHYIMV